MEHTIVIEVKDEQVLQLLQHLADMELIRMMDERPTDQPAKLSDRLRGAFTKEDAESFDAHVRKTRSEWNNS